MAYDPDFDFGTSADVTVPCAYTDDSISAVLMGRPPGVADDGNYHLTIFVQEDPNGPAVDKVVQCPIFTDEEAQKDITVHVYVTHQGGTNTHKKKTGSVPTSYIGGSVAQ